MYGLPWSSKATTLMFRGFALFSALLCVSCASFIASPISDDARDTSGQFDGQYVGTIDKMPLRQQYGNSYFKCYGKSRTVNLRVKDGRLSMNYRGKQKTTNVGDNGKFYLEIETDQKYGTRSDGLTVPGSDITHIYRGRLGQSSKGAFVVGKSSLGGGGCSADMQLARTN